MKKTFLLGCVLCLLSGCRTEKSTESLQAVTPFDLKKYMGTWYEIARLPHSFEKDMQEVRAEYTLQPDGRIRVVNRGMKNGVPDNISGWARKKKNGSGGELEVSFFRPFYGDYKILYLDAGYTRAIVTSGTYAYLWILARNPADGKVFLPEAVKFAGGQGFDCSKLEYPEPASSAPERIRKTDIQRRNSRMD